MGVGVGSMAEISWYFKTFSHKCLKVPLLLVAYVTLFRFSIASSNLCQELHVKYVMPHINNQKHVQIILLQHFAYCAAVHPRITMLSNKSCKFKY